MRRFFSSSAASLFNVDRLSVLRSSVHKHSLYGSLQSSLPTTHTVSAFRSQFLSVVSPGHRDRASRVILRGRISAKREQSKKLIFYSLESTHPPRQTVQVMCSAADCAEGLESFLQGHSLVTRGDVVCVVGQVGATKTGELSVMASNVFIESPCLHNLPLPGTLTSDLSTKRRRRHLDMLVNENVSEAFVRRSKIISWLRKYVEDLGFLEVETPILSLKSGGASATPFQTLSDPPLYLRIAPELYLKRLIVGGLDAVYEIGKQFRNEGVDKTHVNEFTTMELYRADWDYENVAAFTEHLLRSLVKEFHPSGIVRGIDFNAPFQKISIIDALSEKTGRLLPANLTPEDLPMLKDLCDRFGVRVAEPITVGRCIDKLCGHFLEPLCQQPTFLMDHPKIMSPLAKGHRTKGPGIAERFELFIGGLEYVNAYSELNDPEEQLRCFQAQVDEGDPESPKSVDYDFVEALSYGMPNCGGWGLGVDRMVMLLTETDVIDDVIFFPRETTQKQ